MSDGANPPSEPGSPESGGQYPGQTPQYPGTPPPPPPPPQSGYGQRTGDQFGQPPSYAQSAYRAGFGAPSGADVRPGGVTTACVITWVTSGLAALLCVLMIALSGSNRFREEIQSRLSTLSGSQTMTVDEVIGFIVVVAVIGLVWCLTAIVLAVFVAKRHNWARVLLTISAAGAAILSLIGIASGLSAVTLIASVAAIVLLFTGRANAWFRGSGSDAGGGLAGPSRQGW